MKCPLQGFEGSKWGGIEKVEAVDCLQEECAWWEARNGHCVALSIADRLHDSALALEAIKEKMPHVGQFLR